MIINLCPALFYFFFASLPKKNRDRRRKSNKKRKAIFGEMLRAPKNSSTLLSTTLFNFMALVFLPMLNLI